MSEERTWSEYFAEVVRQGLDPVGTIEWAVTGERAEDSRTFEVVTAPSRALADAASDALAGAASEAGKGAARSVVVPVVGGAAIVGAAYLLTRKKRGRK